MRIGERRVRGRAEAAESSHERVVSRKFKKSPRAYAFGIGTSFAKFTPNAANWLSIVVSTTMGRFAIHMARQFLQQDVGYS